MFVVNKNRIWYFTTEGDDIWETYDQQKQTADKSTYANHIQQD